MYYNATLCNLASADLHTGINGTVVVVGVQCLFVAVYCIGFALWLCNEVKQAMCKSA